VISNTGLGNPIDFKAFMKIWLKVICVALLAYVAVSTFWYPLIPAGLQVNINKINPGENQFTLTGYNTHFVSEKENLQVFVAIDSTARYCGSILNVIDNNHVLVSVNLPDTLSSANIAFVANDNTDGYIIVEQPIKSEGFVLIPGYKEKSCKISVIQTDHKGFGYPYQPIIMETIRNLMWHVPMWFTMFVLMTISFIQSIKSLNSGGRADDNLDKFLDQKKLLISDTKAAMSASTGLVFCLLGLITGSVWARFAWGAWWTNDPQLNGAMVVFIVYVAYFILRNSTPDLEKRARLSSIFNIFAFVLMVVLLMVMPRFTEGLHPGKSGNPAFSQYDLDSSLRVVFYPAVLGFILLGYWLYRINLSIRNIEISNDENEY